MIIEMKLSDFDVGVVHDILLEATGESFTDQAIDDILNDLPSDLKGEIAEWGIQDTVVREALFDYWEE